jgi:hypothetical protein
MHKMVGTRLRAQESYWRTETSEGGEMKDDADLWENDIQGGIRQARLHVNVRGRME